MSTLQTVTLPAVRVIGYEIRTTNAREADPATASIPSHWAAFVKGQLLKRIPGQKTERVVCAVYCRYESGAAGEYSLVLGAEVDEFAPVPQGMTDVEAPAGAYAHYVSEGEQPAALVATWQHIWHDFAERLTPPRSFVADFERHDLNHPETVKVFVGLQGGEAPAEDEPLGE